MDEINDTNLDASKSLILAPYNTGNEEQDEFISSIERKVINKKTIKFASKLRELNRRYERNNNSNIDNGIYVKSVLSKYTNKASIERLIMNNPEEGYQSEINDKILAKMVKFGFNKEGVIASINSNLHNSMTTCYYLFLET